MTIISCIGLAATAGVDLGATPRRKLLLACCTPDSAVDAPGEIEGGRCTPVQSLIKVCEGLRLARYGEAGTDGIGLAVGG